MVSPIIVAGSIAFDHIMSMPGRFSDHIMPDQLHILNVSFIMKTFRQEFGGTGGNISYTLGLLRIPNTLVSVAGGDFSDYKKHLLKDKRINVNVKIYKNEQTARGFVITDRDDNQIWGFYDGAMRLSIKVSLNKYLKKDSLVMIAPNNPVAMEKYVDEAIEHGSEFMFDPAFNIPHFRLRSLKKAVFHSTITIGNDYEITLIKKRLGLSTNQITNKCKILITTRGSSGSVIQTKKGSFKIPPAKPKNSSDPTGAGDAYRSGFLAGYIKGMPLDVCGKMGAISSVYTVEKYGTQTHKFSINDFKKRYEQNFGEEKALTRLG